MRKIIMILVIAGIFISMIRADSPPMPREPKGTRGTMVIKIDNDGKEAVLKLNRNSIKQLRAALDEADDNNTQTAFSPSRAQTIVSGLFLSVAFLFGGVWMFRAKPSKTIIGIFLLAILGTAATTLVWANAGPPPALRSVSSSLFSNQMKAWRWGSGEVKIQIVNGDSMTDPNNAVELIVPQSAEDKKADEDKKAQ